MVDSGREFIRNNFKVFIGHILIYLKGIILIPLLIKNIGVELYGTYVLLITGIIFISGISTFGVGFRFKRYIPSVESVIEKRNLFYPQFYFQLNSAFIVSTILILLGKFIRNTILKGEVNFSMYFVAAILVVNVLYSASTDFFRYTHRINYFVIATTGMGFLTILFIAIAFYVFRKNSLNFLLLAHLSSLIIISIPLVVKIYKELGTKFPTFRIPGILEDMRLGFPLVLSNIVDFILSASDKYIIAILISATAVGYYSPAYALGTFIILFPKIFGVVIPQLLSRAIDKNRKDEVKVIINYSIEIFLLIIIPFIVGSFFLSKPLLELLANKEVADSAYLVVPIVAGGTLFYGLNLIIYNIFFAYLKTKIIFGINALSAILNLLLNIIFIYIFKSILVAAITTLLSYFISFIVLNLKVKEYLKINYNIINILKSILSSIFMIIPLYYMKLNDGTSIGNLILSIFVVIALYIILLFVFKVFNRKEINYIKQMFKKNKGNL